MVLSKIEDFLRDDKLTLSISQKSGVGNCPLPPAPGSNATEHQAFLKQLLMSHVSMNHNIYITAEPTLWMLTMLRRSMRVIVMCPHDVYLANHDDPPTLAVNHHWVILFAGSVGLGLMLAKCWISFYSRKPSQHETSV